MKRPHVIINCAMSADGKIASPTRKQMRISCEEDIERMYRLRNECDAVLVGVETILADDPKLTVKDTCVENPRQPIRVVLDTKGRTPPHALVLNDVTKTIIITAQGTRRTYIGSHIEVIECKTDHEGLIDLTCALNVLSQRGIRSLLVEGGGTVIWNFLSNKVVDDLYIFIGSCIIGGKDSPTLAEGKGIQRNDAIIPLKIVDLQRIGSGILIHYQPLP